MSPKAYSRTDARYWLEKIFHRRFRQGGEMVEKPNYYVQIQHQGRRKRFHLHTPNKATAAARARDLYKAILEGGWAAVGEIEPKASSAADEASPGGATVGDLISVVRAVATARPTSLDTYFKAFRKIAADIARIQKGAKYDSRRGGSEVWRKKVDAVPLSKLTPEAILEWKIKFLKSSNPTQLRKAKTTVNSLIRNSKALFAKKHLKYIRSQIDLPDPLPFDDVPMEKQPSMRYQSKVDAGAILKAAQTELAQDDPECFKILLLGLMCGLRKSEIDTLLWAAFDFEQSRILIEPNEYNQLKSEDSAGEVEIDAELNQVFWQLWQDSDSAFVIESHRPVHHRSQKRSYRAEHHFKRLNTWLREHGVNADKPMHEMRKEFGALINARYGIYAASRALRHSQIAITVAHYTDKKERVTVGLGNLLTNSSNGDPCKEPK